MSIINLQKRVGSWVNQFCFIGLAIAVSACMAPSEFDYTSNSENAGANDALVPALPDLSKGEESEENQGDDDLYASFNDVSGDEEEESGGEEEEEENNGESGDETTTANNNSEEGNGDNSGENSNDNTGDSAGSGDGEGDQTEPQVKPRKNLLVRNKNHKKKGTPRNSNGYSAVGTWNDSSLPGDKGFVSHYSGDPTAEVTYTDPKNRLGGRYCIYTYNVTHPNRNNKATFEVTRNGEVLGTAVVAQNLPTSGAGWKALGEYNFELGDQVVVRLFRGENSNGGFVSADDVKFKLLKEHHDCQGKMYTVVKKNNGLIDNRYDQTKLTGKNKKDHAGYRESLAFSQSSLTGTKKSISRYSGDPNAQVKYQFLFKNSGEYCFRVYKVTHPNSTEQALLKIDQGREEPPVHQQVLNYRMAESEKGWVNLGSFYLLADVPTTLTLSFADPSNVDGYLRADAVQVIAGACKAIKAKQKQK